MLIQSFRSKLVVAGLALLASTLVSCNAPSPRPQPVGSDPRWCGVDGRPLAGPPPTTEGSESWPFDAQRDSVFQVEKLGCSLVAGVGCGHLLAPLLARIDAAPGVQRSATNWTGAYIRVTAAQPGDRARVLSKVQEILAADEHPSTPLPAVEASRVTGAERWWPNRQVFQLTSHEFRTHSQRTIRDFAQREKLDNATTAKLVDITQTQWDAVARSSSPPPPAAEAYAVYWNARLQRFADTVLVDARPLLTAEQFERLKQETPCE